MHVRIAYEMAEEISADGHIGWPVLSHLAFVDRDVGWAVGQYRLLHTTDGGQTWQVPSSTRLPLEPFQVVASNRSSCWVSGGKHSGEGCYFTADGGETWTPAGFGEDFMVNDLFFYGEQRGWALTTSFASDVMENRLFDTRDGGKTWHSQSLSFWGGPTLIRFTSESEGWLVMEDATFYEIEDIETHTWHPLRSDLYHTSDGGVEWKQVATFEASITDLVIKGGRMFIVTTDGELISSADKAGPWTTQTLSSEESFDVIAFLDDRRGLILGSQRLRMTQDGGDTWAVVEQLELEVGNAVHFLDNHNCVIATGKKILNVQLDW
jgi:photosystem II stability/assembly factor-like uncharacterized protein